MNIRIKEKIEEIRKQPEHIRMRYVWGSLAVSMVFIFIIWVFSMIMLLHSSLSQSQGPDLSPVKAQLQNFQSSVPSIQNISNTSTVANQDNSDTTTDQPDSVPFPSQDTSQNQ